MSNVDKSYQNYEYEWKHSAGEAQRAEKKEKV